MPGSSSCHRTTSRRCGCTNWRVCPPPKWPSGWAVRTRAVRMLLARAREHLAELLLGAQSRF